MKSLLEEKMLGFTPVLLNCNILDQVLSNLCFKFY